MGHSRKSKISGKTIGQGILIILGVLLGLYVGGWLCFINGIGGMITAYQTSSALLGVWSLVKFLVAGPFGWGIFILFTFIASLFD
jgi:amino acid transporter